MYKLLLILIFSFYLSGCSVHEAWTGDVKPGLSYVSIDRAGQVVSNNKGAAHLTEVYKEYAKLEKQGDTEALKTFLAENADRATLFIWSSEYNGAMTNGAGKTCLQAATYAKSTNVKADVSDSLLSVLGKIDVSSEASEAQQLLALEITQTITKLNESTAESTYLSAGLFGLCVLQANGGIDAKEIESSIKELIKASSLNKHNKKLNKD